MVFSAIAAFAQKHRIVIVVFWIAAAAGLFLGAPKFSEVTLTDESQFLPQNTQSAAAARLLQEKFVSTSQASAGSGIIVFYDAGGLTDQDMQEARSVRDWLTSASAPRGIEQVTSIFDNDILRQSLISSDQTTMMMPINFSVPPMSSEATAVIEGIREYLSASHPQIQAYFTGQVGLLQDLFQSIQQTIGKTTIFTIILVLLILLIIYRSPIAALLPLVAIGCSFLASMGILGFLGQAGVKFFSLTEAYLVVIVFGIGTDYCLFIVSRFREELKNGKRHVTLNYSMRHIGPVIAASALIVIVAFLCLSLSQFGMNKTAGYALAIGIGITLLAGLTLIPALMSLFGKYLFWPNWSPKPRGTGGASWAKIGDWVVRRPLAVAIPIIVVLLVPYIAFSHFTQTPDVVSQMPASTPSVKGYYLIEEHFPPGELSPLYLLVKSPGKSLTDSESLRSIEGISQSLQNVSGVSRVDYFSAPAGQLAGLAANVRGIGDELGNGIAKNISLFQTVGTTLQGLILQYPGIVQSQNFQQIGISLGAATTSIRQLSSADQTSSGALLGQLQRVSYSLAANLDSLVGEFNLTVRSPFTVSLRQAYFSADQTIARINLALTTGPYATETIDTVARLRAAATEYIEASGLKGSTYYVGGEGATRADIMSTSESDFGVVVGSAIAAILIVIAILLRSIVAPLYMVATVLLNYGATLGVVSWLFSNLLKQNGMIYMIPIFIFIFLVALGADYNIFLVSRIREEASMRPLKEAIRIAIANTGGVITSCGIIVAGTFATLLAAPLQMITQIGAAIFIGVIIDTFVVRALLVPAIATLIGRWSWWPSGLSRLPLKKS